LLAKLASWSKGGRQKSFIQETLKAPRTTTGCAEEVQQVNVLEGGRRGHRLLTQETLRVHKISAYDLSVGESSDVCLVDVGETWMTPYRRYLADGLLPQEPTEAKILKKSVCKYTLVDEKWLRHGYTDPILSCVSGEQCTRIMAELHEGIYGSHIGRRTLSSKVVRAGYY